MATTVSVGLGPILEGYEGPIGNWGFPFLSGEMGLGFLGLDFGNEKVTWDGDY